MFTGKYYRRLFVCPRCGTINTATKRIDQRTHKGHRKWLWCYKCCKKVNQIQISK